MKKCLLITFIILAMTGVSRLFAIEKSFDQPRLGSEIRQIMFTCQNPMQVPENSRESTCLYRSPDERRCKLQISDVVND